MTGETMPARRGRTKMRRIYNCYSRKLSVLTLFASIAALLLPGSLLLAEERYLEEIIVTGTKRDTSQQDTPIAVSTLSADNCRYVCQRRACDCRPDAERSVDQATGIQRAQRWYTGYRLNVDSRYPGH